MSSESESEELFYDAEDLTPNRVTKWVFQSIMKLQNIIL